MKASDVTIKTPKGNLRRFLQETLVSRCKQNPSYSLRAFARALSLEPSFLSKLLSGKRTATVAVVKKIALKLSLDLDQTNEFLNEAQALRGKTQEEETPRTQDYAFHSLQVDQFQMIADWYHYAILELTTIEGFQSDAKWIAKRLGIKIIEAQTALERLERLELIEKNSKGVFVNTTGSYTTVGNDFTNIAFKKLQAQIIQQSLEALDQIPLEERDQSSMTIAMDPELMGEVKERIKRFRRELASYINRSSKKKKTVYQLSVSYFPVSKG